MPIEEQVAGDQLHVPENLTRETWEMTRWLRRFGPELQEWAPNPDEPLPFAYLAPVVDSLQHILNEDLSYSDEAKKHGYSVIAAHNALVAGVPADRIRDIISEVTVVSVDTAFGESNPKFCWWHSFIEQSRKKDKGSLTETGGEWRVVLRPDVPSVTHGAEELQQTVAQALVELAQNATEQADKPLAFHPNPPSVAGRTKVQELHESFLATVEAGDALFQSRPHLAHIIRAQSRKIDSEDPKKRRKYHSHDALTKIQDGETFYRDILSPVDHRVRLFREGPTPDTGYYCDMSVNEYLLLKQEVLEKQLTSTDLVPDRQVRYKFDWKPIDKDHPPDTDNAPALSVSSGPGARPDSIVYAYARNGEAILHAHYNTDTHRMELYWNHVAVDGNAGKQMSFGTGYAIQKSEMPPAERDKLFAPLPVAELFPPNYHAEMPGRKDLEKLNKMLNRENENSPALWRDNKTLIQLVRAMDLSEIVLTPKPYKASEGSVLDTAVAGLNELFYARKIKALESFLESHTDPDYPLSPLSREELKRFVALQFNTQRIVDLVSEAIYGPLGICMIPSDGSRLVTTMVPEMNSYLSDQLQTFYPLWKDFAPFMQFLTPVLPDMETGKNLQIIREIQLMIYDHFQAMYDTWSAENAFGVLNMPLLSMLQENAKEWRDTLEILGARVSPELYYKAAIQGQRSDVASNVAVVNGFEVALETFTSALTSNLVEEYFSSALGSFTRKTPDGTVIQPTYRHNLTPQMLDALDIDDNERFRGLLEEVFEALAPHLPYNTDELHKLVAIANQNWWRIRRDMSPKIGYPSLVLSTMLLEDVYLNHKDLERSRDMYLAAIQIILATGLYRKALDTKLSTMGTATELPLFLKDGYTLAHLSE